MTSKLEGRPASLPFIFYFAERLPSVPPQRLRFDPLRQISQVFQDGSWVDAVDALPLDGQSRLTRVSAETTDDK
jgi:hypothetical protein